MYFSLLLSYLLMQLRKQFSSMNLKIPAKRIFGDNFDPGKCSHLAHISSCDVNKYSSHHNRTHIFR